MALMVEKDDITRRQIELSNMGLYVTGNVYKASGERHRYYGDGVVGSVMRHAERLAEGGAEAALVYFKESLGDGDITPDDVLKIQSALNAAREDCNLVVDGLFGKNTAKALASYLEEHPELIETLSDDLKGKMEKYLPKGEYDELMAYKAPVSTQAPVVALEPDPIFVQPSSPVLETLSALEPSLSQNPKTIQEQQIELSSKGFYVSEGHPYYADGDRGVLTRYAEKLEVDPAFASNALGLLLTDEYLNGKDMIKIQGALNAYGDNLDPVNGRFNSDTAGALADYLEDNPERIGTLSGYLRDKLEGHLPEGRYESLIASVEAAPEISQDERLGFGLLDFISKYESEGRANVVWNRGSNGLIVSDLTEMSLDKVQELQVYRKDVLGQHTSSGLLQINHPTLTDLRRAMRLTGDEPFSREMQLGMGGKILRDVGLHDYYTGVITKEEFGLNLSKKWAALPKDAGGESFYEHQADNSVLVGWNEFMSVLEQEKALYEASLTRQNAPKISQAFNEQNLDQIAPDQRCMQDYFKENLQGVTGQGQEKLADMAVSNPDSSMDIDNLRQGPGMNA